MKGHCSVFKRLSVVPLRVILGKEDGHIKDFGKKILRKETTRNI
jgi:hypothetical protein